MADAQTLKQPEISRHSHAPSLLSSNRGTLDPPLTEDRLRPARRSVRSKGLLLALGMVCVGASGLAGYSLGLQDGFGQEPDLHTLLGLVAAFSAHGGASAALSGRTTMGEVSQYVSGRTTTMEPEVTAGRTSLWVRYLNMSQYISRHLKTSISQVKRSRASPSTTLTVHLVMRKTQSQIDGLERELFAVSDP
eukprot:SAG31_NODE_2388_length_5808_cov_2.772640_1_plen_191_part_10